MSPVLPEVKIERDHDAGETAVARQAAFPNHKNFPRARQIVVRLVKQNVSEHRADDGANDQVEQPLREIIEFSFSPTIKLNHYLVAEEEPKRKEKSIPADMEGAEMKNVRVRIPH